MKRLGFPDAENQHHCMVPGCFVGEYVSVQMDSYGIAWLFEVQKKFFGPDLQGLVSLQPHRGLDLPFPGAAYFLHIECAC